MARRTKKAAPSSGAVSSEDEHLRAMRVQLEVLLDGIPRDDAARERLVRHFIKGSE